MKSLFKFCALLFPIFLFTFKGYTQTIEPATIYIYRTGKFICSGVKVNIDFGNAHICQLKNSSKLKYSIYSEGKLKITASEYRGTYKIPPSSISLDIKSGNTYYILEEINMSGNYLTDLSKDSEKAQQEFNGISDSKLISLKEDINNPLTLNLPDQNGGTGQAANVIQNQQETYGSGNPNYDLNGWWEKSGSGVQFLLRTQNYGFDCVFSDGTLQVTYFGNGDDGRPVYKANFGNDIIMFKAISLNEMQMISTIDPNLRSWTKVVTGNQNDQSNKTENMNPYTLPGAANTNPMKNIYGWQNTGYENNPYTTPSDKLYIDKQFNTLSLVPGTSYVEKKRWLDREKSSLKDKIDDAEKRYKLASSSSQISIQFELDRLNLENNNNDMKLLDLEQMRLRGEIK